MPGTKATTFGSFKVNGDTTVSVQSYDDLEDTIHELHDNLWIMANSVGAEEPLQAKQQLSEIEKQFNALKEYVEGLPEPKAKP